MTSKLNSQGYDIDELFGILQTNPGANKKKVALGSPLEDTPRNFFEGAGYDSPAFGQESGLPRNESFGQPSQASHFAKKQTAASRVSGLQQKLGQASSKYAPKTQITIQRKTNTYGATVYGEESDGRGSLSISSKTDETQGAGNETDGWDGLGVLDDFEEKKPKKTLVRVEDIYKKKNNDDLYGFGVQEDTPRDKQYNKSPSNDVWAMQAEKKKTLSGQKSYGNNYSYNKQSSPTASPQKKKTLNKYGNDFYGSSSKKQTTNMDLDYDSPIEEQVKNQGGKMSSYGNNNYDYLQNSKQSKPSYGNTNYDNYGSKDSYGNSSNYDKLRLQEKRTEATAAYTSYQKSEYQDSYNSKGLNNSYNILDQSRDRHNDQSRRSTYNDRNDFNSYRNQGMYSNNDQSGMSSTLMPQKKSLSNYGKNLSGTYGNNQRDNKWANDLEAIESDVNEDKFMLDSDLDSFRDGDKFTTSHGYDQYGYQKKQNDFGQNKQYPDYDYMNAAGRGMRDEDRYKMKSFRQDQRDYLQTPSQKWGYPGEQSLDDRRTQASSPFKKGRDSRDSPHRNMTPQNRSNLGSQYSGSAYDASQSKYQDRSMIGSQYSGSQSYVNSRAYQDPYSNQYDYDEIKRRKRANEPKHHIASDDSDDLQVPLYAQETGGYNTGYQKTNPMNRGYNDQSYNNQSYGYQQPQYDKYGQRIYNERDQYKPNRNQYEVQRNDKYDKDRRYGRDCEQGMSCTIFNCRNKHPDQDAWEAKFDRKTGRLKDDWEQAGYPNHLFESHARATIIGAFVGNACGVKAELKPSELSDKEVALCMKMNGGGPWNLNPGQITDDSELMLCLLHYLAFQEKHEQDPYSFDAYDMLKKYKQCNKTQIDVVGTKTQLSEATRWPIQLQDYAAKDNHDMGGCALARIMPLAVWAAQIRNPTMHRKVISAETEVTHSIPLLQDANFVYAQTIAFLLHNATKNISSKVDAAFDHAMNIATDLATSKHYGQTVKSWLQLAKDMADSWHHYSRTDVMILRDLKARKSEFWARHPFVLAFFFMLRVGRGISYVQAIEETIRQGGKATTNAAIVGGLIGAVVGQDQIPEEMRFKVLDFDSSNDHQLRYRESRRPDEYSVKVNFEPCMDEMLRKRPRKNARDKQPKVDVYMIDGSTYKSKKINRDVYQRLTIKVLGEARQDSDLDDQMSMSSRDSRQENRRKKPQLTSRSSSISSKDSYRPHKQTAAKRKYSRSSSSDRKSLDTDRRRGSSVDSDVLKGHDPQTLIFVREKWAMLFKRMRSNQMMDISSADKKKSMETIMMSDPKGAHKDVCAVWDAMDIDEDLFGEFWAVANPEQPYLDDERGTYKRWRDLAGRRCEGFVTKQSARTSDPVKHGYVRSYRPDGELIDATYKHGEFHGLYRRIMPSNENEIRRTVNIVVAIYKNGDDVADFQFDQKFQEQSRIDAANLFDGLGPKDFKKYTRQKRDKVAKDAASKKAAEREKEREKTVQKGFKIADSTPESELSSNRSPDFTPHFENQNPNMYSFKSSGKKQVQFTSSENLNTGGQETDRITEHAEFESETEQSGVEAYYSSIKASPKRSQKKMPWDLNQLQQQSFQNEIDAFERTLTWNDQAF